MSCVAKGIQEEETGTLLLALAPTGSGRAVFLDRDGVLNDLVYNKEEGRVLSPFSAAQLRVFPYVPETIKTIKEEWGFKAVIISNQPGVAKGQFSRAELERMNAKVRAALESAGTSLDAEYYCLHHPDARIARYRVDCDCRKPKPGMLFRAAKEASIDLRRSYLIGDSLIDVVAGKRAGCKTILVGHLTALLARVMKEEGVTPDYMIGSLKDAPRLLAKLEPGFQRTPLGRGIFHSTSSARARRRAMP